MPETPGPNTPSVPEIQARLQAVADLLRQPGSIDPAAKAALAALVDELSKTLQTGAVPTVEVAHLAESTALLAESLHHHREHGLLEGIRDRLDLAVINAEAHAPIAVGLARRLMDALANIGV